MYSQDQQDIDQDYKQRLSLSASRGIWSSYQSQPRDYSAGYFERCKLVKTPSDQLKSVRKQLTMPNKQLRVPSRKQNQVISNLKNQLQNIKSQVAKLMNKEGEDKVSDKGSDSNFVTKQKFNDTSSASSLVISRQLKPRLITQRHDKDKYMQIENQLLQNELKSLKNKYVTRKAEYKEQNETLRKKIMLLQGVIAQGQQQMAQYKIDIENQILHIRNDMVGRSESQGTYSNASSNSYKHEQLCRQCQDLKQEVIYLKKRTTQANEQIKHMAIQNNELQNQLKRDKNNIDIDKIQSIKKQFTNILRQKDEIIAFKQSQIIQMINKQQIANEVVKKNTELIQLIRIQRQRYQYLEQVFNTKVNELAIVRQNISNDQQLGQMYQNLQREYANLKILYQSTQSQQQIMRRDLSQLGGLITDLKYQNAELKGQLSSKQTNTNLQSESQKRCQELQSQLIEFKSNVVEMVRETAQKINYLELENQTLKNQRSHVRNDGDYLGEIEFLKKENQKLVFLINQQTNKSQAIKFQYNNLQQTIKDFQEKVEKEASTQIHSPLLLTQNEEKDKLKSKKYDQLQSIKTTLEHTIQLKEKQIAILKNDNSKFSSLYLNKCKQIEKINLLHQKKIKQFQSKQSPLKQMVKVLTQRVKQYQEVYTKTLKQTKDLLTNTLQVDNNNLDESLKIQMDSITKLRSTISTKNQQIHNLRQSSNTLGSVVDSLRNQLIAQRNKLVEQRQLQLASNKNQVQHFQNQIITYQQTITSLEQKILLLLAEIKKKDELLAVNLTGDLKQPSVQVQQLITRYTELFTENNLNFLNDSLRQQIIKIDKLSNQNNMLMREISRLQQLNVGSNQKQQIGRDQNQGELSVIGWK